MTAGRMIRCSTTAAVSVVALVAAFVSCRHALQVVRQHGESGVLAQCYPLTVDGLIYAASMVLLDAGRRGVRAHWLAWAALGQGIAVTPVKQLEAPPALPLAFRCRRCGPRHSAPAHGSTLQPQTIKETLS